MIYQIITQVKYTKVVSLKFKSDFNARIVMLPSVCVCARWLMLAC